MDESNNNAPVQPAVDDNKYLDEINFLKEKIKEIEDVKKSLSELESLKSIYDEVERLKGSVSKLETDYEPISGVASVQQEKIDNIQDYFTEHMKLKFNR